MKRNPIIKLRIFCLLVLAGVSFAFGKAQQNTVSGTITDGNTGGPMAGVTVQVEGTLTGGISQVDGTYSTNIPDGATTLIFSFVGFQTQEILINGRSVIDVAMIEEVTALDEVIVIGYGTMRKSDLTGSVARVTMDDKSALTNLNVTQALTGTTAGVNVVNVGGAGQEPDLSVRGQTSLSATDAPLIVVDGIIFNGDITDINVNDVETVDILKDASAAAVYGSRSANGVVLITTKKGASEKPLINFSAYYGYQDMTNNPMRVMNAEEYAIRLVDYYWQQDLYTWYATNPTSDAGKPAYPDITDRNAVALRLRTQEEADNYLAGNEMDWVKEVLQIAPIQNYNLSASGASERTSFYFSGSYTNEEGILKNDQFERITLHANLDTKITDWLSVGLISSYTFRDYSGLSASLSNARSCTPLANPYEGNLMTYPIYVTGELYMTFPLDNLKVDNVDKRNNLFLVGNAKITVPWIQGLTYEFNYSNTFNTAKTNQFGGSNSSYGAGNHGHANKSWDERRDWIFNNIVSYNRTIGEHQVNATLLYSREGRQAEGGEIDVEGFDNEALGYNNVELATIVNAPSSSAWKETSVSYMARANYTFRNRYMITGTIRRDGFSGFGAANKFATFPSVSLGWVTSGESFMGSLPWLYLKLRASYGQNGNQGIGRYSSISRMGTGAYVFGPNTAIGVYPSSLGNADLGWETTTSLNLGIDFGLFSRRIDASIDIYKAQTSDVLVQRDIPTATGYTSVWTNIGAIDNKGIEIQISSNNLSGQFGWTTDFVFSLNRDEISKLYGEGENSDIGNEWFVGEPIDAIYSYKMAGGVWTEAELYNGTILDGWYPGQFRYVDLNSDGVIEPNNDRTIIGYESPSYRFSINNTFTYKNFALTIFINAIQGGDNYYLLDNASVTNVDWRSDNVYRTNLSAVRPYWTPWNGVTNATGVYNTPAVTSDILESRSFVRLQDVSLSYTFGPAVLNKLKLQSCQIYVASKNPYVWTKWSGWDPETGTSNTPMMRNITAGIRMSL